MNSLAALIAATSVLVLIPGPNVALIVANSLRFGFGHGALTVLGTTAGVALQLLLVVAGLTALVQIAAEALTWLRWVGVIYLVYLGVKAWRTPAGDLSAINARPAMFWRGAALAVLNPKILLFNAAFIPQFVGDGSIASIGIVAVVYLLVLLIGDLLWALFAATARRWLQRYAGWRNRLTGGFLVLAGAGLAAANRNV